MDDSKYKQEMELLCKKSLPAINQLIGQRIRDNRKKSKLTQKVVAEKLNISLYQFRVYEYGKKEVPFHALGRMTLIFDISLYDFFINRPSEEAPQALIVSKPETRQEILSIIRQEIGNPIPPEEEEELLSLWLGYMNLPTAKIRKCYLNLILAYAEYYQ